MSSFNEKANKIMASLLIEGTEEESKVVKVKTPTGMCDVRAKCITTPSGCTYIADESVDCVNKGDDVTDMIASEDEENCDYNEENEEDPELAKILGGKDPSKQLAAVSVAGKLATKASGGLNPFNNPQKKMNKAYDDLMGKIATRISNIASKI